MTKDETIELLRASLLEMKSTASTWEWTAQQESFNTEYYRNLVIEIGKMFGHTSYVSDDGSVQEDVLCAKVPELVRQLILFGRFDG